MTELSLAEKVRKIMGTEDAAVDKVVRLMALVKEALDVPIVEWDPTAMCKHEGPDGLISLAEWEIFKAVLDYCAPFDDSTPVSRVLLATRLRFKR